MYDSRCYRNWFAVDIMTDDFTSSDGELVDMIHDITGTDCVVVVMIDDVTGTGCEVDVMVDNDTGSIWKKVIELFKT